MNKLISFGDSFTWGTDLKDAMNASVNDPYSLDVYKKFHNDHTKIGYFAETDHEHKITTWRAGYSRNVWPALLANAHNLKYVCYAEAGSSNQSIVRQFFQYLPYISVDDKVVVNWTWIDRWDFFTENTEVTKQWLTIRASDGGRNEHSKIYHKYIHHELWCKLETLKAIMLIASTLKNKKIPFIMTSIDTLAFDTTYHIPSYIANLQNEIADDINWFDDVGFYDWAKNNNYKISKVGNHPLEEAHIEAFKYAEKNFKFN
jgi:hypothetical protein